MNQSFENELDDDNDHSRNATRASREQHDSARENQNTQIPENNRLFALLSSAFLAIGTCVSLVADSISVLSSRSSITLYYNSRPLITGVLPDKYKIIDQATNHEVVDPYISTVTLKNTGKVDIDSEMFDKGSPIYVNFGKNCEIFQVTKSKYSIGEAIERFNVKSSGSKIMLSPALINSGDQVSYDIYTSSCEPYITAKSSIKGIKKINVVYAESSVTRLAKTAIILLILSPFLASVTMFILNYWRRRNQNNRN